MKPKYYPILSNKDVELLFHLWKFRLATFKTVQQVIFHEESPKVVYDRLRKLKRGQFITIEKMPGTALRVICLEKLGFNYLAYNVLPELKSKRYRPHSHHHDLLASAGLIGDWTSGPPTGVRLISEQELKSVDISELSKSYPQGLEHHPDGIWVFTYGKEKEAVALEVELTAKSSLRYEQICTFYGSDPFFRNVIWIIKSTAHGNQILQASKKYGVVRQGVHLFILRKDFESLLWRSPIKNSLFKGMPLACLMHALAAGNSICLEKNSVIQASPQHPLDVISDRIAPLLDFSFNLEKPRRSRSELSKVNQQHTLYGPYSI